MGTAADAGSAKKAASKALKTSTNHIQKEVKADVLLARLDLFATLDGIEHDISKGFITGADGAQDVFIALAILQIELIGVLEEAREDIRLGMGQAAAILANAQIGTEDFPAGFRYGDGGVTDDLRANLAKELGKVYKAVDKRLEKTRAQFKKKANRSLTCRLVPVTDYVERAGVGPHTDPNPLSIDVAVATSDLDATNDAEIHVAGACYSLDGTLQVMWANQNGGQAVPSINPPLGNRWSTSISGLVEENYSLRVLPINKNGGGGYLAIGAL